MKLFDISNRHAVRSVALIVLATLCLAAVAMPATAQNGTTTEVSVVPQNQTVAAGDTATYEVVVADAPDGISSYAYTLTTSEPATATLTGVTLAGSASAAVRNVQYAADNSSVNITAGLADIGSGQTVSIGTVTLTGVSAGTVGIDGSVTTLLDGNNDEMTVSAVDGATLTVTPAANGTTPEESETAANGTDSDTDAENATANGTTSATAPNETDSDTEPVDATPNGTNDTVGETAENQSSAPADDGQQSDTDSSTDGIPGFGVAVALLSLTATSLLLRRNRH